MIEFKGARAAIQAFQFILKHLGFFLNLAGTWALIMIAFDIGLCLLLHPAGPGTSLTDNLIKLNESGISSGGGFLRVLGTALGNLVISVNWVQFVVPGREPRNPVRLMPEMGVYFGRLIGGASAIPGVIVAVGLVGIVPGAAGKVIAVSVGSAASLIPALVVYGRLNLALASAAVGDDTGGSSRAFELTKGRSLSCAGGCGLAYLIPLVPLLLVSLIGGMIIAAGLRVTGAIVLDITTAFTTYATACILSGYQANMYAAFVPGDHGDQIARHFE